MPFARPYRLRVQDALVVCLQGITIAAGYKHDLATSVFRGRLYFGDSDPLPLVSILEPPLPLDQIISPEGSTDSTGDWDLLIQGFAQDDKKNPTDPAHLLLADVKSALAKERKKGSKSAGYNILGMGGAVTGLNIGPGVVRPPDEISAKAYFWLGITLQIVEDIEAPYA